MAADLAKFKNPVYCSFCGKSQHETEVMLAGTAAAFICAECVEDAREQIAKKLADDAFAKKLNAEAVRCAFCIPEPING